MPISTPESAESATRIDLVYMGCLAGAEGSPTLPAQKHDSGDAVQSATSNYGMAGPALNPVTIQFYAPENTLTYFSFASPGGTSADDPSGPPIIITITVGNEGFTGGSLSSLVSEFFNTQIVENLQSTEIVPGQYWQNVSRKTMVYIPYLIDLPSGTALIILSAVGTGYSVGETLTITGSSGFATLVIAAVGISNSIRGWNATANTFTGAETGLAPTGGGGSGATFAVYIVP
jgi:hypothetical protein